MISVLIHAPVKVISKDLAKLSELHHVVAAEGGCAPCACAADVHLPTIVTPNIPKTDSVAASNCSNMVQYLYCGVKSSCLLAKFI